MRAKMGREDSLIRMAWFCRRPSFHRVRAELIRPMALLLRGVLDCKVDRISGVPTLQLCLLRPEFCCEMSSRAVGPTVATGAVRGTGKYLYPRLQEN
jgi:hypothetical protein